MHDTMFVNISMELDFRFSTSLARQSTHAFAIWQLLQTSYADACVVIYNALRVLWHTVKQRKYRVRVAQQRTILFVSLTANLSPICRLFVLNSRRTSPPDVNHRSLADPIYGDKLHFMKLYVCIQVDSTRDSMLL